VFKLFTNLVIIFILFTLCGLLFYNNLNIYNSVKNLSEKYSGYENIPLSIVEKTIPIEEIYGKITNIIKSDSQVSFDLLFNNDPNKIERVVINKNQPINYVFKITEKSNIEINQGSGVISKPQLNSLILNLYISKKEIVDQNTFFNQLEDGNIVYINFKNNNLSNSNSYVIDTIIYETN